MSREAGSVSSHSGYLDGFTVSRFQALKLAFQNKVIDSRMERVGDCPGKSGKFGCDVWRKAVGDRHAADYEAELREFPGHMVYRVQMGRNGRIKNWHTYLNRLTP